MSKKKKKTRKFPSVKTVQKTPESTKMEKDKLHVHASWNPTIPKLDFTNTSNLADAWKNWYLQFKLFLIASNQASLPDLQKNAMLLHLLGPSAIPIFNSFRVEVETISHSKLIKKFEDYCTPKKNLAIERNNFFTRKQNDGESIEEYVAALTNLSLSCELGDKQDSLINSVMIAGLSQDNSFIREKLLQDGNTDLTLSVQSAKALECARAHSNSLSQNEVVAAINKYSAKKPSSSSYSWASQEKSSSNNKKCSKCGQLHRFKCPATNAVCNNCKKVGHFEKFCFFRNKNIRSVQDYTEEEEPLFVDILSTSSDNSNSDNKWEVNIPLKNSSKSFSCLLDTGSQANVMSHGTFCTLGLVMDGKVHQNLFSFTGQRLNILGKCTVKCYIKNKEREITFYVSSDSNQNVLGLPSIMNFNLLQRVYAISEYDAIFSKFKDVFEGIGCLPQVVHLSVDKSVTPCIDPPRKVPFKLMEAYKKELKRMEELDIIKKCEEPTEWVSSSVIVTKQNGSIRICIDPRRHNKAIKRPRFPFPTIDDVKSKLNGATIFSILDARNGFWSLKLDEESSKLCCFNSPFGRYRYLRLPFGLNASPEIFFQRISQHFQDIENLIIYMDDFLIFGKSKADHDAALLKVLNKARTIGLKFNKNKSKLGIKEIKYVGHIFNASGVQADPEKIKCIQEMKPPSNDKELQRFLGCINYLGAFIPNLSQRTTHLRSLLKKENNWSWSEHHQQEFEDLKKAICSTSTLAYYDPNRPLVLSVDASQDAIGAVILHTLPNGLRPIAYASTTMTEAQKRYSQIEKELLAICYGANKFHQYIFGNQVTVQTDHKPLITIQQKPFSQIPARLQRLMLKLQKYSLNFIYVPGSKLYLADTLSRTATAFDHVLTEIEKDLQLQVNLLENSLSLTPEKLKRLKEANLNDPVVRLLAEYSQTGWPSDIHSVPDSIKPYYKFQNEINIVNGLVFRNESLVIPSSFRTEILKSLHHGHQGLERSLGQIRGVLFWPAMTSEISNYIRNCQVCQKYQPSNSKEPLIPHYKGVLPWEKVGVDLFHFQNSTYLIAIDYYSSYFEIAKFEHRHDIKNIIVHLKSIFSRHGIPQILVSDNSPFNCDEFSRWCKEWDIRHETVSPYHHQSNGMVERAIRTVKNMMIKCQESNSDFYLALLQYRNSPKGKMHSPSELLMSRKLRDLMPQLTSGLRPKVASHDEVTSLRKRYEKNSCYYYNKGSRGELEPFRVGEKVLFQKYPSTTWIPGVILKVGPAPRSYTVQHGDRQYRRNRVALKHYYGEVPLQEENKKKVSEEESLNVPEEGPVAICVPPSSSSERGSQRCSERISRPPRRFSHSDYI